MFPNQVLLFAILTICKLISAHTLAGHNEIEQSQHRRAPDRELAAALRKHSMKKRSDVFHFSNEAELIYAER